MSQWIAVALALLSALCLAVGTQQQGSVVAGRVPGRLRPRTLLALLGERRWLLGLLLLGFGTGLNVAALALATVTVVQPIGVVALVVTTLLHARHRRLRINRRTWTAIALCTVGGAAFVTCAVVATDPSHSISRWAEHTLVGLLALLVGALGAAAGLFRRRLGGTFHVAGAGVLYGFVAVLVRLTLTRMQESPGGPLDGINWLAVAVAVVAAVLGGWFVQSAFASGPPDLVIAGLTVLDPMVGVLLGLLVLGEAGPGFDVSVGVLMAVAGAVAIVGVAVLSQHHPEVLERRADLVRRAVAPPAPAPSAAAPDPHDRPGSHA